MKYFNKFPQFTYDFSTFKKSYSPVVITDCLVRLQPLVNDLAQNIGDIAQPYRIKEGETPDIIAHKMYGKAYYHWTIFLINNIWDYAASWPLDNFALTEFINTKYNGGGNNIKHYVNKGGFIVNQGEDTIAVTNADYEYQLNENKRKIIIVKPDFVELFVSKFEDKLGEIKDNYVE